MSFVAPFWLGVAAIAALGVVALHLITTQRPPPSILPTARFVPAGDARASSRAARPADLPLLALRCAALLLMGAAFAGPVTHSGGSPLVRVIAVDRSRGAEAGVRDSVIALARAGDALVPFDSSASIVMAGATDSLRALAPGRARGSLSAALVSAWRAARDVARAADSVELVIVSPLTTDELDAASAKIFARWPGRVRLVRTAAARRVAASVTLESGDPDDALRPADRRAGRGSRPRATHARRFASSATGLRRAIRSRRWPARRSCTGRAWVARRRPHRACGLAPPRSSRRSRASRFRMEGA